MRMRRDAEAVAAYRDILREQGKSPDGMSDEQVIECVERTMDAILSAGRAMAKAIQGMVPALARTARAMTDVYAKVGATTLVEEIEVDRRLRDEVGMDARLLALFDEPRGGKS